MKHFYLIRHGEKVKHIGNPPLTPIGVFQAQLTGQFLKTYPITFIASSPLLRTQQTSHHIAEHLQLPVLTHDLLKERKNWGDSPDQSYADFLEEWRKSDSDRDFKPSQGDSSRAAGQRIERFISSLHSSEHEHIAIITHGGVIRDFIQNIAPDFKCTEVAECSITRVTLQTAKLTLEDFASTSHLHI